MTIATMFKPADEFGAVLTARPLAEELRRRIEAAAVDGPVTVDFGGVKAISPSFADELFAKIPAHLTETDRVRFENLSGDLMAVARFVISNRTG